MKSVLNFLFLFCRVLSWVTLLSAFFSLFLDGGFCALFLLFKFAVENPGFIMESSNKVMKCPDISGAVYTDWHVETRGSSASISPRELRFFSRSYLSIPDHSNKNCFYKAFLWFMGKC